MPKNRAYHKNLHIYANCNGSVRGVIDVPADLLRAVTGKPFKRFEFVKEKIPIEMWNVGDKIIVKIKCTEANCREKEKKPASILEKDKILKKSVKNQSCERRDSNNLKKELMLSFQTKRAFLKKPVPQRCEDSKQKEENKQTSQEEKRAKEKVSEIFTEPIPLNEAVELTYESIGNAIEEERQKELLRRKMLRWRSKDDDW